VGKASVELVAATSVTKRSDPALVAQDVPVVIVTGYPDGELMAQAMAHGSLTLLAKPIDRTQVQKLVTLLVGKRRTEDARTESETCAP
jgi:FixJ family two-component response regulator